MSQTVTLDKRGVGLVLTRLSKRSSAQANTLYTRVASAWGPFADRERVTLRVCSEELKLLHSLHLPPNTVGDAESQWRVVYQHPTKPHIRMVVYTSDKPPKRRTFRVGSGQKRLVAISVQPPKEAQLVMATRAKKASTKSKKAPEVEDDLDELDELEDLEDLEDEDVEDEEPDEEEDDEEEEPVKPRSRAKKAAAKPAAKRSRKRAEPEPDEDDEDEDEDDEPAPRRKGKARQSTAKTKAKSSGKRQPPAPRPLPAGKLSPADVAEQYGDGEFDARVVRIYLRSHAEDWPKDEESFRYAFSKKEAQRLAREIKKSRKAGD